MNQASLALDPPLSCNESPHPVCCHLEPNTITACRSDTAKPTPNARLQMFLPREKSTKQQQNPTATNQTQKTSQGRIKDNPNPKGQNFCVWRTFSALMISYASCASQFLKVQVKSNETNSCTQPKTPELKETLLISLVTHSLPRSHVDMMLWMPHLSLH